MDPTILRFVDDTGATRLDLNDPEGFQLVKGGINLGTDPIEGTWLAQPPNLGAIPAGMTRPNVEMMLRLILTPQANWADVANLWTALAMELDRKTNVLDLGPNGDAGAYLIDTFRSPIPSLFRGQDKPSPEAYQGDPEPVELLIYRKPKPFRGSVGGYI